ncbi:hypothetical protein [Methanocella conradii]|uniref:hypothetical protein n=1 Tax=Methanocella conradii TaxID=1175444 RepID=UPI00157D77A2|nr:hypothetical protein [Methanocella conradii]
MKLVSPKYLAASCGIRLDYKLPRMVARQPDTLNPLKAWGLLEACTMIRDRAIVAVYYSLRNKELCALNVED